LRGRQTEARAAALAAATAVKALDKARDALERIDRPSDVDGRTH
jgi:hypothetical protein